jgi:aminoglycoside/choline kinase family phosphotransferase
MGVQPDFSSWIESYLPSHVQVPSTLNIQALAGDAGFRTYYRLNTCPSLIAVDSPPHQEKNSAYIAISLFLQSNSVRTPVIYAVDFKRGYMLLEDFGDKLFQRALSLESRDALYQLAESTLMEIQGCAVDCALQSAPVEDFDRNKLTAEMALFEQWFVNQLLGVNLEADKKALLNQLFERLISSALQQPQVLVHSDYHCRNLMLLPNKQLGIIDFQDAMRGPITYDLVSLLRDCYVRHPSDWVTQRALEYRRCLQQAGVPNLGDEQQFLRWFDLMGLQRHIKVLGIFSRLALRDSKAAYLSDIPLVMDYCLEVAARYSDTAPFGQWLKAEIAPLLVTHSWYSESRDKTL